MAIIIINRNDMILSIIAILFSILGVFFYRIITRAFRIINQNERPRFRLRHVTPEMIETVHSMFPDIPTAAIKYDLQKTGSVEVTCENILKNNSSLPMLHEAIKRDTVPNEPPKVWEATPEKRQKILQWKKDAMVLQARKLKSSSQPNNESKSSINNTDTNINTPTSINIK
ncbi:7651_t:CDS:2 [Entrophospora sp. SA101]|nr:7651_t:CDS:2 [Entrophospora sp. SA101]